MKRTTLLTALAAVLVSGGAFAQAAANQPLPPIDDNAPVFGSQIMTPEERTEHRQRMRAARTLEEREQIRAEHHRQMVDRAKERGVTLPAEPPPGGGRMMGPGGRGMGPGNGMMGPGGMGPGGMGPRAGQGSGAGQGPGGGMGSGGGQGPSGAGAGSPGGGAGGGGGGR